MKTIRFLLTLLPALLLAACDTTTKDHNQTALPATDFLVSVTCSEPTIRFTGLIISDGHARKVAGVGRGTFQVRGHQVICSFEKKSVAGRIAVAVSEAGRKLGESSTQVGGVRGEFLRGPAASNDVFTTF